MNPVSFQIIAVPSLLSRRVIKTYHVKRAQVVDKFGLSQLHSTIESRSAVQYSSSGSASLPDCADQNFRTSDGGKDGTKGAI
jgi:hypothetical protein